MMSLHIDVLWVYARNSYLLNFFVFSSQKKIISSLLDFLDSRHFTNLLVACMIVLLDDNQFFSET